MNLVAVTSGKGGTGRSCVAAYTGVALSAGGKRTLLIEQGASFRSLDIILATQNDAVFDLDDVLAGRCSPEKAIVPSACADQLFLLPGPSDRYQPASQRQLSQLVRDMRQKFDYILVDGVDFSVLPPSLFDTILLVTTADTLSVRACQSHARELYDAGAENIRLVINNVPSQITPIFGAQDFDDIINMIGCQLIGVIPHSPKLHYSANNSKLLDEESATVRVFDNIAARLRGQPRPLLIW